MFKARNKPFVLVFWSRDPDGTQHNQGDSLYTLTPGINGPTSLAAIKNADDNLAALRKALDELGLAADHRHHRRRPTTASPPSPRRARPARPRRRNMPTCRPALLPPGFVAIDLAKALELPLHDPDNKNGAVAAGTYPKRGNGLIGADPANPQRGRCLQWRLRSRLYSGQRPRAHRQGDRGAAGAGLRQRPVRRRRPRQLPRHAADVRDQPEGPRAHAAACRS